ncbi:hypothetical protein KUF71_011005 [Frankliniella fusca]|uniref:Uncharacterized protein n=1 Tax=Frankliniella fusca TaxID=407009 RepID=A0AAE1LKE3_9NEOP|nr:hypothetical protein KUF71_011005 [Frankliniella fusca]
MVFSTIHESDQLSACMFQHSWCIFQVKVSSRKIPLHFLCCCQCGVLECAMEKELQRCQLVLLLKSADCRNLCNKSPSHHLDPILLVLCSQSCLSHHEVHVTLLQLSAWLLVACLNGNRGETPARARCCSSCDKFPICVSNDHGFRCGLHDKYFVEFMGSNIFSFTDDKGTSPGAHIGNNFSPCFLLNL